LRSILYKNYVVSEYMKYPFHIVVIQDKKGKLINIEVSEYDE